jgi:hypothetical protein
VAALMAGGCAQRPLDATPEGSARELVERMRRVQGDPAEARAAYDLLSKRARDNLAERAARYGAASGKSIAPEAMIVPSRFSLRFEPQRYEAQVSGALAQVTVRGDLPEHEARIMCVLEDGRWRVDMALPSLPPVQQRPGSDMPR